MAKEFSFSFIHVPAKKKNGSFEASASEFGLSERTSAWFRTAFIFFFLGFRRAGPDEVELDTRVPSFDLCTADKYHMSDILVGSFSVLLSKLR